MLIPTTKVMVIGPKFGGGSQTFPLLTTVSRSKNFGYVNAADARLSSRDDKDRKEKEKAEKELWNIFHPGEEMSSGTKAGREKENSTMGLDALSKRDSI